MRYRREDANGDYTFGQGDNTFLVNSPDCVAQAVFTRFQLWQGQWFLNTTEGTPYLQSILGKQPADVYSLAVRDRISGTQGVNSIQSFDSNNNGTTRRVSFTATIDTIYGTTTVSSGA
jgi:hypothetical protein